MPFDRVLTFKLQKMGINCCLKCISNYFSCKKTNFCMWSGRYKCLNKCCSIIFEAKIEKWNSFNLSCKVFWHGNILHEKMNLPKTQCRGRERQQISNEVMSIGTENLIVENKLKDLIDDNCKLALILI